MNLLPSNTPDYGQRTSNTITVQSDEHEQNRRGRSVDVDVFGECSLSVLVCSSGREVTGVEVEDAHALRVLLLSFASVPVLL
jgi:hypothetical protein